MVYESFSQIDTEEIGFRLAGDAEPGSFYALIGGLGAGKTAFVRGFARRLGVGAHVSSPTFAIVNEYLGGDIPLYHFDVYRIGSLEEFESTGYEDYFYGKGIVLVEWADLVEEAYPEGAVVVKFEHDPARGDDYRKITVET
ncbi:MAG: tRNA (adenosine(37)-N6)-threonylcarbamoyltransferase complex ATPase subunit type 1 TsaE [Defluviitaleaceae bacterium]|nr:tRNA (adenosine(37)-N6)-threonylcarbamoyltransferase complex ATPase subunit type 1 TsaE [Defluviitaleaceae bacterium]